MNALRKTVTKAITSQITYSLKRKPHTLVAFLIVSSTLTQPTPAAAKAWKQRLHLIIETWAAEPAKLLGGRTTSQRMPAARSKDPSHKTSPKETIASSPCDPFLAPCYLWRCLDGCRDAFRASFRKDVNPGMKIHDHMYSGLWA